MATAVLLGLQFNVAFSQCFRWVGVSKSEVHEDLSLPSGIYSMCFSDLLS